MRKKGLEILCLVIALLAILVLSWFLLFGIKKTQVLAKDQVRAEMVSTDTAKVLATFEDIWDAGMINNDEDI